MNHHKKKILLLTLPILVVAIGSFWALNNSSKNRKLTESLPSEYQLVLNQSSEFVVFSLLPLPPAPAPEEDSEDSVPAEEDSEFKNHEKFHGHPVLGKFQVKDQKLKEQLLAALYTGVRNGDDEEVAGCFKPRHGIQASHNGKTLDLVICFECQQFKLFAMPRSGDYHSGPVARASQSSFDRALRNANVPLGDR